MVKCNCNEEKRQSYNQGFLEGKEVGLFDGKKIGSINMLRFFLNFYNDGKVRKRISISTSYLEKRLKELKGVN